MNLERVVVDASVVVRHLVPHQESNLATNLLTSGAELMAPFLCCSEVGNALWKYVLGGFLEVDEAIEMLNEALALPWRWMTDHVLLPVAIQLAVFYRHPVYDCLYISLAKKEDSPLVTADKKLVETFDNTSLRVMYLGDLV